MQNTQNRLTDLHLSVRLGNPGLLCRHTPMTLEMQANLQNDVKALTAEYLQHLKAPMPKPEAWAAASIEILTEDTVRYIETLESLLQEAANETEDEEFAARIDKALR